MFKLTKNVHERVREVILKSENPIKRVPNELLLNINFMASSFASVFNVLVGSVFRFVHRCILLCLIWM